MIQQSRVRELRLRVRVPASSADRARSWRDVVERQILIGALERLDERVTARLGPRAVVRIKSLPIRWSLAEHELADPALPGRLGDELVEALLANLAPPDATRRPYCDDRIAVFFDAAQQWALALVERASGKPAAFYHPHSGDGAELWRQVAAMPPPDIATILERLAALGASEISHAAMNDEHVRAQICAAQLAHPSVSGFVAAAPTHTLAEPAGDVVRKATSIPADITVPSSSAALALEPSAIATRAAGAFFLVTRVLELDLAEHLWCVGAAEGLWIAHALQPCVPPPLRHDPAFSVIAGCQPEERLSDLVPLAAWACDELHARIRDSLGARLAKLDVATTPNELDAKLTALMQNDDAREHCETSSLIRAALSVLVSARLEVPWSLDTLNRVVTRPGAITFGEKEIAVTLPMDGIDIDLRRAGIDFDPGWVPWLERKLRIAYA